MLNLSIQGRHQDWKCSECTVWGLSTGKGGAVTANLRSSSVCGGGEISDLALSLEPWDPVQGQSWECWSCCGHSWRQPQPQLAERWHCHTHCHLPTVTPGQPSQSHPLQFVTESISSAALTLVPGHKTQPSPFSSALLTARFPIATGKPLYSNGFARFFFFFFFFSHSTGTDLVHPNLTSTKL